ncbi:MAG: 2TM domain-containing protein [Flavobacteriaceae bacterium]|nr:2TM domain-containing protein [Flavobacteriaceae bacterium]
MKNLDELEGAKYLRAKKRVEKIKGFYVHLSVYVIINIFISGIIIYGLTYEDGDTLGSTLSNFGVYSTWVFWGVGVFFHWLGVFGFNVVGRNWEERKLKEIMEKEKRKSKF